MCVWRGGGGKGGRGGGVCLPPVANSKFFTYIHKQNFFKTLF